MIKKHSRAKEISTYAGGFNMRIYFLNRNQKLHRLRREKYS
jgi:hypothetical protein